MSAFVNRLLTNNPGYLLICWLIFIPVLPHVFPKDCSWYSALNLIARHAVTAAIITDLMKTPMQVFPAFSLSVDLTAAFTWATLLTR